MTRRDIERFFTRLAKAWPHPTDCLLIGGAAAVLEGSMRPTADVDFEVRFRGRTAPEDGDAFVGAVRMAEAGTGYGGQFGEDIGAWSPVALPPYRGVARRWKSFGCITVRTLPPVPYVLTKLRRGSAADFTDILLVIRRRHPSWRELARSCGTAVRLSQRSTALTAFVKRVEYLFRRYGRGLWGPRFAPDAAVILFRKASVRPGRAISR